MTRTSLFFILCLIFSVVVISAVSALTQSPIDQASQQVIRLPNPHYLHEADDPDWLQMAVQLHGHLGPAIVVGVRMGAAGLDAVQAQGYFDVEVTAQGPFTAPPQSCILDGLQLSTGATLGKHNLKVIESDEYLVVMKNKRTGKTVEIRPTPQLLEFMWSRLKADDHDENDDAHTEMHQVETLARQIVGLPQNQVITVKRIP